MDSTKKLYHQYLLLIIVGVIALNTFVHLSYFGVISLLPESRLLERDNLIVFRLILVIFPPLAAYLVPSVKAMKGLNKSSQNYYRIIWFILSALLVVGYFQNDFFYSYNFIFFPMLFFVVPFLGIVAFTKIGGLFKDDDPLAQVNKEGGKDALVFPTKDKGDLVIPLPYSSIFVTGSPNAGKSGSWANRLIDMFVKRGSGAVIYELKGDELPLSHVLYNSLLKHYKDPSEYNFAVVAPISPELSVRVNPVSPKYITKKVEAETIASTLLYALNPDWIKAQDKFWSGSAISVFTATLWRIIKTPKLHRFCNLPSIITMINYDEYALFEWLKEDEEIKYMIRPVVGAMERQSSNQVSGVFSSIQLPLSKLMNPEVFWIFSPNEEEDFDLNVKTSEKPTYISIASDRDTREAMGPVLSVLLTILKNKCNKHEGHSMLFLVDEFVSVFIKDFIQLPAEARSSRVCSAILTQNYAQLRTMLGKDFADSLARTISTWAIGMGTDAELSKEISALFGKKQVVSKSQSISENLSVTERMDRVDVLEPHQIAGQEMGQFAGIIANGKPPRFQAKLKYFDPKVEFKEIRPVPMVPMPIDLGDLDANLKAFKEIIKMNYDNIISEVEDLLFPYKPVINQPLD